MMASTLLLLAGISAPASAFSFKALPPGSISLSSSVERDVFTMADWAAGYGVQQAEGVTLTSYDGKDYFPMTQMDIPAGSPVIYVPNDLIISSSKSAQEFGADLQNCENALIAAGLDYKVALFRVFYRILSEYQNAENSPFYPWLNSMPRVYNTGASMTYACEFLHDR